MDITIVAEYGVGKYGIGGNGNWYQEGYEYTIERKPEVYSLGIADKINDDWSWRFGYSSLGKIKSDALAVASDNNYNPANNPPCNGACWPLSRWLGSGKVEGLYASGVYHIGRFNFELGVFGYHPKWEMNVKDWVYCPTDEYDVFVCTVSDISVRHHKTTQLSPFGSIGVDFTENLGVRYKYFLDISARKGEYPAIYKGEYHSVNLTYSF